jgi:HSP20 family protein
MEVSGMLYTDSSNSGDMLNFNNIGKKGHRSIQNLLSESKEWGQRVYEPVALHTPPVDISEDEHHFYVHTDLPGIDPQDIVVELFSNAVEIRAEKRKCRGRCSNLSLSERNAGIYHRRIQFPAGVMMDQTSSRYQNGVLSLSIPKKQPTAIRAIRIELD